MDLTTAGGGVRGRRTLAGRDFHQRGTRGGLQLNHHLANVGLFASGQAPGRVIKYYLVV